MIPERMPPPDDQPIGWSPNALGSTSSQIAAAVVAMTAAQAQAFLLSAIAVVQFSRTMTFTEVQSLASAPIVVVDKAVIALPVGWRIRPIWFGVEQQMAAALYSAPPALRLRYSGLAVDLTGTIAISNAANRYLYTVETTGNSNTGNTVHGEDLSLVVATAADVTAGSGSVRVFGGYTIVPVATV